MAARSSAQSGSSSRRGAAQRRSVMQRSWHYGPVAMEGFPDGLTAITYEAGDDGVATVTLDRPDTHNAFNAAMCEEMAAMWAHVRDDPAVRAVVVTGAVEKAFCTGIDRSEVP